MPSSDAAAPTTTPSARCWPAGTPIGWLRRVGTADSCFATAAAAFLPVTDPLHRARYLVVAEMLTPTESVRSQSGGLRGDLRIQLAAPLDEGDVVELFGAEMTEHSAPRLGRPAR